MHDERAAKATMTAHLPFFLGIGTQKGGTTTLHQLLNQHPDVYIPDCKEVHYFDQNFDKPLTWYNTYFKSARTEQYCGDITPFYMFHPDVPQRIKKVIPSAKLIVLLRDPVERTLSHLFHAQKRKFENLNITDALKAEDERLSKGSSYSFQKHSYMSRSRYLEQLNRYEAIFPKKQLLILKSEDLFSGSAQTWYNIQRFLTVKITPMPIYLPKANAGKGQSKDVSPRIRAWLRKNLEPTAAGVRERYGFGWDWC